MEFVENSVGTMFLSVVTSSTSLTSVSSASMFLFCFLFFLPEHDDSFPNVSEGTHKALFFPSFLLRNPNAGRRLRLELLAGFYGDFGGAVSDVCRRSLVLFGAESLPSV